MKHKKILACFLTFSFLLTGCSTKDQSQSLSMTGTYFDTVVKIEVWGADSKIMDGCKDICEKYEQLLSPTINSMGAEEATAKLRLLIDGILGSKAMLVTIVAFTITVVVVYLIRRMSVDHSWTIAMIAGVMIEVLILLVGDLMYDTNLSIFSALLGAVVTVLVCKAIEFFRFCLDYSRTEKVQFEDDEYYYYVKAVPKMTVAAPTNTVKKINTQRRPANQTAHPAGQGRPSGQSRSGGQNVRSAEGSARSVVTERTAPARSSAPYGQQNPYRGREMTGGRSVTISSDHMAQDDSDDYEELF